MRKSIVIAIAALLTVGLIAAPASAARGGEKGSPIVVDAIRADGDVYATIPQNALPYNGNNASYDQLFLVPGQEPVAEAAPGNSDYNGGRWLPTPVEWVSAPYLLTSSAAVHAAAMAGDIIVSDPVTEAAFLCPLIPNH